MCQVTKKTLHTETHRKKICWSMIAGARVYLCHLWRYEAVSRKNQYSEDLGKVEKNIHTPHEFILQEMGQVAMRKS